MKACNESIGRRYKEKEDTLIKNSFMNDYNKILNSKAIRRLSDKTQVLCSPDNPHVRTRAVHTNEVITNSVIIAENLGLNTNLCMAIAAGHDIGHAPYGHGGQKVLSELSGKEFKHNVYGVVIAQHIEREGKGLNLTHETLEGMLNHSIERGELKRCDEMICEEYAAVLYSDKISYTLSDLNDAIRYGYLDKIPKCAFNLGRNQRHRVIKVLKSLINESKEKGMVEFSEGNVFQDFAELRGFLFDEFYDKVNFELQEKIIHGLYNFFLKEDLGVHPVIAISLLTDLEATRYGEILLKSRIPKVDDIKNFGLFEILPYIKDKPIDFTNHDLKWKKYYKDEL